MSAENEQTKTGEEAQPVYKNLTEKNFKFGKSYLVRDPINGSVSEYVPKAGTGLAAQANKFAGFVARGLAVAEDTQSVDAKAE